MQDALAEELSRKESLVNTLIALANSQNAAIKSGDTARAAELDIQKHQVLSLLSDIDNSIKPFILKNRKYPRNVQEIVVRMNESMNILATVEKENEKLLPAMELSASGRHIQAYKNAPK